MASEYPQPGLLGEKTASAQTAHRRPPRTAAKEKMPSPRNFIITLLVCLLVTAGFANAFFSKEEPCPGKDAGNQAEDAAYHDDSTFSRLLSSASPQALHEFLHAYFPGTYRHGVFDSDNAAIEAVHVNDPELATSIVQLAKRQGNDTTTATSAPTDTSATTTTTASGDTTTTQAPPETTSTSPTSTQESTASVETPTTTETDTVATSSSVSTDATSTTGLLCCCFPCSFQTVLLFDTTLATTTSPSSTITTSPPRTSTFISTLPGGAQTTITSVEVVTNGGPQQATTTDTAPGSLQTGLAFRLARDQVVEVVVGAVVGAALLV
ncbi:hypothetical protein F4779DRAFT_266869 [Xylariaceae sp. FL0662B]|nr:hypothetical protein F4779DRAFT_266869 [Xylariaceae sp. FL0662B]